MKNKKISSLPKVVAEISRLNFEGNILPHSWYQHIKLESGKPDLPAIIILAEVVYWYRPYEALDPKTGQPHYQKRFQGDMFQSSAAYYENKFGLTKDQTRKALKRLEDLGLIRRELREITLRGVKMNNAMFIEPVPAKIAKITYSELDAEVAGAEECEADGSAANCATCPHAAAKQDKPAAPKQPTAAPPPAGGLIFDFGLKDLTDKQRDQLCAALAGVPDAQAVLDELNSAVLDKKVKARKPYLSYIKTLAQRAIDGQFTPTSDLPERRRKAAAVAQARAASESRARCGAAEPRRGPPGGSLRNLLENTGSTAPSPKKSR